MSKNAHPMCGRLRPLAFTLVELLTVIAIVVLMMVAAVPAFNGFKGAGQLTSAAYDVSGLLEQARAYAMAHNTYVFVGFAERDETDLTKAGVGQVWMVAMASRDGTRNASSANLKPVSRLRRLENTRLEESIPNSGELSRPVVAENYRLAHPAFAAGNSFSSSGCEFSKIILFDPRGMASVQSPTQALPQWIEIGLVRARGTTENCAALVLDGVTGAAKIYRP